MIEIQGVSTHIEHKEKCGMVEVLNKDWEDPCLSVPSAMEAFLVTFTITAFQCKNGRGDAIVQFWWNAE